MDYLNKLQQWYKSQCNEEWEHSFGIQIDTLDNPGWGLEIDLIDTELENKPFVPAEQNYEADSDWLTCSVVDNKFKGACGPMQLNNLIRIFVDWANGN